MNYELQMMNGMVSAYPPAVLLDRVTGFESGSTVGIGGTENVWFYDMKADGLSLDDKRQPIEDNDIPDIIARYLSLETVDAASSRIAHEKPDAGRSNATKLEASSTKKSATIRPPSCSTALPNLRRALRRVLIS